MNSELSSSKPTSCTCKKPVLKEGIKIERILKDTFCNLKDNIKGPSRQWNEKPLQLCMPAGARKPSEVELTPPGLYCEEMISNES